MSRSRFLFRDVPMDAWVDSYEKSHQNPMNRVFHKIGIPMIAVSIPFFLIAPLVRGFLENSVVVIYGGLDLVRESRRGKDLIRSWRLACLGLFQEEGEC